MKLWKAGFFFLALFSMVIMLQRMSYGEKKTKNILIVHSLMERNTWAVTFNHELSKELNKSYQYNSQIYYETIGPIRDPDYIKGFTHLLQKKYQNTRLDAILAVLPAACDFAFEYSALIFPDVPVVYSSPAPKLLEKLKGKIVITRNPEEGKEAIQRIFTLLPHTKKVYFIVGNGVNDIELFKFYQQAFPKIPELKDPVVIQGLSLEEILDKVKSLPSDSALFFIAVTLDRYNNRYISYQLVDPISRASSAPLFTYYDSIMGLGIVGGKLSSVKSYAFKNAEILERIYDGEKPEKINTIKVYATDQYDYRQLVRWNIPESRLPLGSEVFFKEQTYFERNWPIILISLIIIFTQAYLIILLLKNLKKRRQAEREILMLNEELEGRVLERTTQLESANKELESFSYSVSHDLRAPLRAIDGFGQILSEDYTNCLDSQGLHYLKRIQEGAKNMGLLIDALLNLSRLGRSELKKTQVDLTKKVYEIIKELEDPESKRKVKWIVAENVNGYCDDKLISVVLQNLLSNAYKFSSKKSEAVIEFGIVRQDQKDVYFVKDNGAGFEMGYYDKLFGAFQRLHHKNDFEGIGIGLATVLRIINRHGGKIWAESKTGEGSVFYFTLTL